MWDAGRATSGTPARAVLMDMLETQLERRQVCQSCELSIGSLDYNLFSLPSLPPSHMCRLPAALHPVCLQWEY